MFNARSDTVVEKRSPSETGSGDGVCTAYRTESCSPSRTPFSRITSYSRGSSSNPSVSRDASSDPDYSESFESEHSSDSSQCSSGVTPFSARKKQNENRESLPAVKVRNKNPLRNPQKWTSYVKNNRTGSIPQISMISHKPGSGPEARILSARLHQIKKLSNDLHELQKKLNAVDLENKLLKQLQSRHAKALRKFEDSESSLPQMMARHSNEVKSLKEQLRRSQEQDHIVSHKLRASEAELLRTKDSLQRLQQLSEDKKLEEREELARKLTVLRVNTGYQEKKIQELEKKLELCNTSFTRHLAAESRKTLESRELSKFLQMQLDLLNNRIREKERELEIQYIYSNRLLKGSPKRDVLPKVRNVAKSVQTDDFFHPPLPSPCSVPDAKEEETDTVNMITNDSYQEKISDNEQMEELQTEERLNGGDDSYRPEHDQLIPENKEEDDEDEASQEETEEFVSLEEQKKREREDEEKHDLLLREALEMEERERKDQTQENSEMLHNEEESQNSIDELYDFSDTVESSAKNNNPPIKQRRQYTFKETVQNLHHGRPAHGMTASKLSNTSWSKTPTKQASGQLECEDLGISGYEPSFSKATTVPKQNGDGLEMKGGAARSKKSSLMEELFGQRNMLHSKHVGPRVSGYSQGRNARANCNAHANPALHTKDCDFNLMKNDLLYTKTTMTQPTNRLKQK
ncbi:lebercilin-like protein isoform X1 [Acipenser ruthenus]|uniref:lebercilin-like protein isoform X1 n=2 Tax=Acipenser ruthenus TaxID=7906 RepID=UPI00274089D3|nr:lebercilin-like protein isoform X1 [Acipenser ruthenus]